MPLRPADSGTAPAPQPTPARLLIVDDEPAQLLALVDTLVIDGYRVQGCGTATEALAALERQNFDLLLTDLQMEGMDGIQLLQAARLRSPELVAVLMTGHGTVDTAVSALRAGAFDFIVKPFRLSMLRPVLERGLETRRLRLQTRALQQRLEDNAAQLAAANRELDAFAARVAHDLRAPIQNMMGFAELLGQAKTTMPQADIARRILQAGRRAEALIDGLLALARTGDTAIRLEDVALQPVVQRCRDELMALMPDRDVEWSLGPLPAVRGQDVLLEQVFVNLLGNALKFSADSAPARIEVLTLPAENDRVRVLVRDNGVGFDPAFAGGLFTPFHRLHSLREFPGTGLGLSLVKRILERLGADITASSSPGAGASFVLSLAPAIKR